MKNNFCNKLIITFFTLILLSSCSNKYSKLSRFDNKSDQYQGHFKYAPNTTDKNRSLETYKGFSQTGIASWYGTKKAFHNKITANGDKFNKDCLTVAHRTLPIPSVVKVTNLNNGKSLVMMVNDRGPYKHKRIVDVSAKGAEILGFKNKGITQVKVEYLEDDTKKLLNKLKIQPKHGSKARTKMVDPKCSVNCQIQLMNIQKGLLKKPY